VTPTRNVKGLKTELRVTIILSKWVEDSEMAQACYAGSQARHKLWVYPVGAKVLCLEIFASPLKSLGGRYQHGVGSHDPLVIS